MPYLVRLYDVASRTLGSAYATYTVTTIDLTFFGTGITGDILNFRVDSSTVDFEVNKIEFYSGGTWHEYTSDTYWRDSVPLETGVWDVDHWDAQPIGGPSPRILLYGVSSDPEWWIRPGPEGGYRPTKMRVTMTGVGLTVEGEEEPEEPETPIVATPGAISGRSRIRGVKHKPLKRSMRWT